MLCSEMCCQKVTGKSLVDTLTASLTVVLTRVVSGERDSAHAKAKLHMWSIDCLRQNNTVFKVLLQSLSLNVSWYSCTRFAMSADTHDSYSIFAPRKHWHEKGTVINFCRLAGKDSAGSKAVRARSHCADGAAQHWHRRYSCRAHSETAGQRVCNQGRQHDLLAYITG